MQTFAHACSVFCKTALTNLRCRSTLRTSSVCTPQYLQEFTPGRPRSILGTCSQLGPKALRSLATSDNTICYENYRATLVGCSPCLWLFPFRPLPAVRERQFVDVSIADVHTGPCFVATRSSSKHHQRSRSYVPGLRYWDHNSALRGDGGPK